MKTRLQVVSNLYEFLLLNTKEDILKNARQLMDPIDFHIFFLLWKSMGYKYVINCMVTDILQNIFFCIQQKKFIQVFKQLDGE